MNIIKDIHAFYSCVSSVFVRYSLYYFLFLLWKFANHYKIREKIASCPFVSSAQTVVNILPFLFQLVHFFFLLLGYFKENIIPLYFNPKYFSIYLLKKRTSGAFYAKEKLRAAFQNAGPCYEILLVGTGSFGCLAF